MTSAFCNARNVNPVPDTNLFLHLLFSVDAVPLCEYFMVLNEDE